MAARDPSEFQWNHTGEIEAISVLDTLPSSKMGVTMQAQAGKCLVDIGATFRQLRRSYLSVEQRTLLADLLRDRFLQFQRLTLRIKDKEIRAYFSHYMTLLGGYAVIRRHKEQEEPFTLVEAMLTGRISGWIHALYHVYHQLHQKDGEFFINETCVDAERRGRHALMRLLLEEE